VGFDFGAGVGGEFGGFGGILEQHSAAFNEAGYISGIDEIALPSLLNYFRDAIDELVSKKGEQLRAIVINAESINNLDSSGVHALEEIIDQYRDLGIQMYFVSVKGPVRDAMAKAHLIEKIGEHHFFMSNQQAVDAFDQQEKTGKDPYAGYVLQTNTGSPH
jgi:SulP family sulfate permease